MMAWHYTVGIRAAAIIESGVIRPATAFVPASERPIVWFSARQHWEPTANKALMQNGRRVALDMARTIEHGGGGWRFGVHVSQLTPYHDLKVAANITSETAKGLERAARSCGADPKLWHGSLEPVLVSICKVERLNGTEWQQVLREP